MGFMYPNGPMAHANLACGDAWGVFHDDVGLGPYQSGFSLLRCTKMGPGPGAHPREGRGEVEQGRQRHF